MRLRFISLFLTAIIILLSPATSQANVADYISMPSITSKPVGLIIQTDDDYEAEAIKAAIEKINESFSGSYPYPVDKSMNTKSAFPIQINDSIDDFIFADCYLPVGSDNYGLFISQLEAVPGIILIEEDSEINLNAISDDYYSDTQWVLDNQGSYKSIIGTTEGTVYSTPDIDLDAPEAWEIYNKEISDTKPVIVALIDTGVDYKHLDLRDNMWINPGEIPNDNIDNDGNGYIDDIYGWDFYNNDSSVCHYEYNSRLKQDFSDSNDCDDHGTHCAGIIAATANNKVGIAGLASNIDVRIMSLKIHGGTDRKGNISDAIKAIKYAMRADATFCNMSWGTYTKSEALYNAMKESGLLFVTAAGNDGINNDKKPLYPASFDLDNIISVGYVDANGILSPDSNYGAESVDIAVPSVDVYSTIVGSYGSMSGSSMAAAHMSGLAAFVYASGTGSYPSNVRDFILEHIKPLKSLKGYIKTPGIPSAYLMAQNLDTVLKDTTPPAISITRKFKGSNIMLELEPTDDLSGINQVRYFIGKKSLSDFAHGTLGAIVPGNELILAKHGFYTFFVRDNAGNETIYPHYVFDDDSPPIISASYKVSFDYKTITVSANVNDTASGIKTVKFSPGNNTSDYFIKATQGTVLAIDKDTAEFKVTEPGEYTIYGLDNRGNKRVVVIDTQIIKSTELKLNRYKKTLNVGKTFRIKSTLTSEIPDKESTDALKYKSSDNTVAKVSKYGKITALKPGKTTITVTTASGLKRKIRITVKKP